VDDVMIGVGFGVILMTSSPEATNRFSCSTFYWIL